MHINKPMGCTNMFVWVETNKNTKSDMHCFCLYSVSISFPFNLVYFVLFLAAALPKCLLLAALKQLLPVVIEMGWHVRQLLRPQTGQTTVTRCGSTAVGQVTLSGQVDGGLYRVHTRGGCKQLSLIIQNDLQNLIINGQKSSDFLC